MLQRFEQFTSSKLLKLQIIKKETRNEYHLCRCPAAVRGAVLAVTGAAAVLQRTKD